MAKRIHPLLTEHDKLMKWIVRRENPWCKGVAVCITVDLLAQNGKMIQSENYLRECENVLANCCLFTLKAFIQWVVSVCVYVNRVSVAGTLWCCM